MGYYTDFKLDVLDQAPIGSKTPIEDITKAIDKLDYFRAEGYGESLLNHELDSIKWYDYQDDMKNISSQFPNVLFTLRGEGEENGDIWVAYFKNGKVQQSKAKITFDEFNESKLV